MGTLTVQALRVVLALALAGSLFVQTVMVPLVVVDMNEAEAPVATRVAVAVIVVLGIGTLQVVGVCVWRLLTMVTRGTVFSPAAFRYVDIVIGAIAAAALLWFVLTAVLAPEHSDNPGITVIMGGIGMAVLGGALIVLVLRMLLAQAVARDVEATQMQAELDDVI